MERQATCEACGGLVYAFAGPVIPESDVGLFNELCWAVEESRLTTSDAAQLALALSESVTRGEEMEMLELAVSWFPNLEPLRTMLAQNLSRARHAFSMVGLILAERSSARSMTLLPKRQPTAEAG